MIPLSTIYQTYLTIVLILFILILCLKFPVEESPQFKPLRGHTVESHIEDKIMAQAMRVATYGVIIKERTI